MLLDGSPDGLDVVQWLDASGVVHTARADTGLLQVDFAAVPTVRTGVQYQNRLNRHSRFFFVAPPPVHRPHSPGGRRHRAVDHPRRCLDGDERPGWGHYDPYDPDRVWVAHPDTGEWIECASRTVSLTTLPFGLAIGTGLLGARRPRGPH